MQSKVHEVGKDSQSTRIHGWKWSHYRLVYFVDQSLHILLRKEEKKHITVSFCANIL